MKKSSIPVTDGQKVILDTVQQELFPVLNTLRELVVRIQKCRIRFLIYSGELNKIENEYSKVAGAFFVVVRKLQTPDILFKNLEASEEHVASYFQFYEANSRNIAEGTGYVEVLDRTLDRKRQTIQNNRTFLLAITAILISVFWR